MVRVNFRFNLAMFSIGSGVVAIGGVLIGGTGPTTTPDGSVIVWMRMISNASWVIAISGMVIMALSFVRVVLSPVKVYDKWKLDTLKEVICRAPEGATIRILQTWLPDREDFIPFLKEQLVKSGKRFRFQIMLMSTDPDCLLDARVKLRWEELKTAKRNIKDTINQLKRMRKDVNKEYDKCSDPLLQIEVRQYDFLPFGPLYQIGEDLMYIGLYLNHKSSMNAPMIRLTRKHSDSWEWFEEHWCKGWEDATVVSLEKKR